MEQPDPITEILMELLASWGSERSCWKKALKAIVLLHCVCVCVCQCVCVCVCVHNLSQKSNMKLYI